VLRRTADVSAHQASFAEFYARTRDDCLRAVFASSGDRQAAEDCVAEAFARAWASWRKVSAHPVPRAWVIRTALNLAVSSWRRRRREVPVGEIAESQPLLADGSVGDGADSPIMTVLAGLPVRQRQVVALRVFLDLDTAATAQALGIAPGTVTAHLARATSALREQLTNAGGEEAQWTNRT
jgi:RNA polymerase sigma factor (sigma-70 family)